jgi:arsenate reductase
MRILFLCSGGGSCRSLIAKAVMQSFDEKLEVCAAGLTQISCSISDLINLMNKSGYRIEQEKQFLPSEIEDVDFDYLITLCDGTKEELYKLPLKYKHKLHLGFFDPRILQTESSKKEEAYLKLIEEIQAELSYFYHNILQRDEKD